MPMGTNCAHFIADIFLHLCKAYCLKKLSQKKDGGLAKTINSSFRYIDKDDVLSLNNARFGDYLYNIFPNELAIKDTINTPKSASHIDLHLKVEKGEVFTHDDMANVMTLTFQ